MNESVIFAIRSGDSLLCEWRERNGRKQHCVPGGKIEPEDRTDADYVHSATRREAREELGIAVSASRRLGEFSSENITFHVVFVTAWTGELPESNRDNQNPLLWAPLIDLLPTVTIEPLRRLLEGLDVPNGPGGK